MTQSELKILLDYDPLTGLFTWKKAHGNKVKNGDIAGTLSNTTGYIQIQINKQLYRAHRLAFLYMTGSMPVEVDHDNRVRHDNKWSNLTGGTHRENLLNQKKSKNNTSGTTGVSWNKQGKNWRASIWIDGKHKNLGHFKEKSDAIKVRLDAEVKHGYHKNHGK